MRLVQHWGRLDRRGSWVCRDLAELWVVVRRPWDRCHWVRKSDSDAIARDILGALTGSGALRLPTSHLLPQLERLIAAAPVGPNDAESAGAAQAQNTEIM